MLHVFENKLKNLNQGQQDQLQHEQFEYTEINTTDKNQKKIEKN